MLGERLTHREIDQFTVHGTRAPKPCRQARRPLLGLPLHDNGHNHVPVLRAIRRRHQRSGLQSSHHRGHGRFPPSLRALQALGAVQEHDHKVPSGPVQNDQPGDKGPGGYAGNDQKPDPGPDSTPGESEVPPA